MRAALRHASTLCALALAAGCSSAPESPAADPEPRARGTAQANATRGAGLPGEIATERLDPSPICVRIEDLPPPGASADAGKSPEVVPQPEGATLQVPEGFAVQLFAEGLVEPRWLALDPQGDVLVTETRDNRITRLIDADGDGVAEAREVFASEANGLDIPFGMAFAQHEGTTRFFLGNHDEVRSYPYAGSGPLEGQGERIARLPGGGYRQHWTRNVVVAPTGDALFVSIGSRSNHGIEPLPRASIQTMKLDGGQMRTYAHGLRNPVGLAFHPRTGALYATVNERDHLGDDLVPDFLARIEDGAFYGYPYAYLDPEHLDPRHMRNGASVRPELARQTRTPELLFAAHSAPLGLAFYERGPFPRRYHGGAIVAFRGSWNRSEG